MKARARRRWRGAEEWRLLMERFAGSGQDLETFCQAEGVSVASFYRWRRLLQEASAKRTPHAEPAFLDLGPLRSTPGSDTGSKSSSHLELTLDLGGGLVLHLRRR